MAPKGGSKGRITRLKEKLHWKSRAASIAQPATQSTADDQSSGRDSAQYEPKLSSIAATEANALPSTHVADHQTSRPSTELSPADQDQPIATSLVLPLAIPVEPLDRPVEPSNSTMSVSQVLWNAAYDKIEADKGELVESYVEILKSVLGSEGGAATTEIVNARDNQIERQNYMRELVKKGRERIENTSKITTKVGSIADFILSSKGIVDLTIQALPQAAPAALPWAGVCLALDILQNPSQEMKSNLDGVAYVISRMDWYCALTELLLNESNFTDDNDLETVLSQLKGMIIELYEALLLYQMKSIVSYYHKRVIRFFRNMGKFDDWESNYQHVKDVEADIRTAMDQYYKEQTKAQLNKISEHAYKLTAQLGNIQQDIRSFILEQKAASRDKDDSECRRELRVVDPQDDMTRIENNKDPLLDDVYKWIFETPEYKKFIDWENDGPDAPRHQILWLKGHAGTGKTMLMIGLIRTFSNHPVALAPGVSFFFCQGTNSELRTATAVLRSLIWLLLLQQPHLISHLLPKYKLSGPSLFTDLNSFIALSEVFGNMLADNQLSPVYLAVDALDECSEGRADLITLISTTLTLSKRMKWLLSSRPEVDILSELKTAETLIELDTECLKAPVQAYIKHKLKHLEGRRGYDDRILKNISDIVYQKADNTFLWVALAFKALGERNGRYAVNILSKMPSGLSELYEHMMGRIEKSGKLEPSDCKKVLKAVFLAFRPLSVSELSTLTALECDIMQDVVEECGSFVTITGQIVNLIHQSAKDYLKDKYDPKRDPDWVALGHANLIKHSLDAISSLEQNIYSLDFDTNPKDIVPPDPDPLAALQYSCVFWVEHVVPSQREQPDSFDDLMNSVHNFLKKGFLRWLESLSLLGKVEDGMRALKEFVQLVENEPNMDSSLVEFSKDAYLFFSRHVLIIQQAPLQTYGSALVFAPTLSLVRKQYWQERKPLIDRKRGFKDRWTRHQTLQGHTDQVISVTFSPDSKILISASVNKEVRLYDAVTGAHRQTLDVQDCNYITSIAISPSGETLAVGVCGNNDTIQLWDIATGMCRLKWGQSKKSTEMLIRIKHQALHRRVRRSRMPGSDQHLRKHPHKHPHNKAVIGDADNYVRALAFSPSGNILAASSSSDNLMRLWNLESNSLCYRTLEGHTDQVTTIVFAPDGTLVSGSWDGTIGLWDTATGVRKHTYSLEPKELIFTMAISPDGNTLASAGETISLWNVADGAPMQSLMENHEWMIASVVFSPNGKALASAAWDYTVRLWDLTSTPLSCKTFEGHTSDVRAVAFSPDGKMLASASQDKTVRLWDMTAPSASNEMPKEQTLAVGISQSGKILASVSSDGFLRLWDLEATQPDSEAIEEYVVHYYLTWDIPPHFEDFIFSPNGRMIALASYAGVQVWDIATSTTINSTPQKVDAQGLKSSPDSKVLASTIHNEVQLRNLTVLIKTRVLQRGQFRKISFSPDSKQFVALGRDERAWLWDLQDALPSRELFAKLVNNELVFVDNQLLETTSRTNATVLPFDERINPLLPNRPRNKNIGYSVSKDGSWITLNGKNLQ
ncbi:WD40-repeat-containing domain protein [Nemania sp. FL0916]|nr:WD40-repeat-containing domain protein [Nemania sp. FL0916]